VNTFTSFDGVRIAYHDEGEGPAVILLHGFGSMAWASSETSSASFRYWKNEKRCFEKCLGERLRYPILPWKEDLAWRGPTGDRCADHSSGHARFRSFRQT
jgi:pimeloyl-ACP methyl ester carboxylesterase